MIEWGVKFFFLENVERREIPKKTSKERKLKSLLITTLLSTNFPIVFKKLTFFLNENLEFENFFYYDFSQGHSRFLEKLES